MFAVDCPLYYIMKITYKNRFSHIATEYLNFSYHFVISLRLSWLYSLLKKLKPKEIWTIMDLSMLTLTLTFFVNILGCYAEDEKIILMSDPQYSHGIEATLQALTSRIDHLETQHQADISQLKGSLSQCHADNQEFKKVQLKGNVSKLEQLEIQLRLEAATL